MEKSTGNKVKLGIFVSAGFALLIACVYLIGERQQLFSNTFHISGVFKNISGLQIGNNVRSNYCIWKFNFLSLSNFNCYLFNYLKKNYIVI